jgi:hypothetical protein
VPDRIEAAYVDPARAEATTRENFMSAVEDIDNY